MIRKRILTDLQEALEPFVAEGGTDDASEAIHEADSTHTSVLWEDGEITYRKNGDLWGSRSWHQWVEPWLPRNEVIWDPGDSDHQKMVVTDKGAVKKILRYYADQRGLKTIQGI